MSEAATGALRAVHALQTRGIDDAELWVESLGDGVVLTTCQWWDKQRNAKAGLLVWKLRHGGVQEMVEPQSSGQRLRAAFANHVVRYPLESVATSHLALQRLRSDLQLEDPCEGGMVVVGVEYPALVLECDRCGLELAVPAGELNRMPS